MAYSQRQAMPRIFIKEPNHFYTYELPVAPGSEVVIGSAPTCQLALPGVGGLSPVHARIVCQPQGYVIEDLKSQYGTLQNGRPVQAVYMMPGAEYMLGAACITLDPQSLVTQPAQAEQPQTVAPEQPSPDQEAAQPPVKKVSVLKRSSSGTPSSAKTGATELNKLAKKYDRSKGGSKLTLIYVVVLLLLAFYAGMALRHKERTGNYLPGIQADGK